MRAHVILLIAALLAVPVSAAEWKGREPIDGRNLEPVTEQQSTGSAIIDFVAGSQPVVVGKTDSRMDSHFAPTADAIINNNLPHALFILGDGRVVMKAIMYRWTTPVDVQIALPYSNQWQVRAIYVGGIMDYAKVQVVPPMFLSGREFSSGVAAAEVFIADEDSRRIASEETECILIQETVSGHGCYLCYECWWKFCLEPIYTCVRPW